MKRYRIETDTGSKVCFANTAREAARKGRAAGRRVLRVSRAKSLLEEAAQPGFWR